MISTIQAHAYRATKDTIHINRAAREMVMYLKELQKNDGLFDHVPDVPIYWGRGNGWYAAGMAQLLTSLPADNPDRPHILRSYRLMMESLIDYQDASGMWKQILNEPSSWNESSGTAMICYAMATGVKYQWLEQKRYTPMFRKAWLALVDQMNPNGDLRNVCEGTNKKNDRQYYLDRKKLTGDMHGQASMLWTAVALME